MENELFLPKTSNINNIELLNFFTLSTRTLADKTDNKTVITSLDIVTAVYYFRSYPNVNAFIEKFLSNSKDYFLLQWVRSTWDKFASMSEEQISDLVINEIGMISNVEEENV